MTPRGFGRDLTAYGDPGFSLFLRKVFIRAAGYSDDALDRRIVGITDTSSDYNPCHGTVRPLIEAVKRGIMLAGALPMVFPTISIHESFASPTSMVLRNLMSMDVEEMVRAQPMDALVVIGGCDKTLPAEIMGAISAGRPTLVLPVGPMVVGEHRGRSLGACTDCRSLWGEHRAGRIGAGELDAAGARLAPSAGTCMVMGTASTMAILAEVLGLTVPYAASAPAPHAERLRLAETTGHCAARLAAAGDAPPLGRFISRASLRNAMVVLQAIGGSTNGLIHLSAIAGRAGLSLDLSAFDAIGRTVPVIVDLKPSGAHYLEHFHHAGGVPRLLAELAAFLDLSVPVVAGGVLGDRLMPPADRHPQDVIRSLARPLKAEGAMAVLRGNLCPRGAVIKQSAASDALMLHTGRAVVFDGLSDLADRIDDPALAVEKDDVLVLRNAGPLGAPGMPEAGFLPIPRKLAQAGVTDMVRISDARMSGTAFGTVVLHVTPEAAAGGPLGLVRTGDAIRLDVAARRVDVLIDAAEWARRAEAARPPRPRPARGYARLYQDHVLQADAGCDFDFLTGTVAAEPAAGEAPP